MDTATYIPNEARLYLAVRFDPTKITEELLTQTLAERMADLVNRLPGPGPIDRADGFLDWSITPWNLAAPQALIRYSGRIRSVQGVVPVKIIDDDTYLAETWLDGDLVNEAVERPDDMVANAVNPDLRDGTLRFRTREEPNGQRPLAIDEIDVEWVTRNLPMPTNWREETAAYDPTLWTALDPEGDRAYPCGHPQRHGRTAAGRRRIPPHAVWHNTTVAGVFLCGQHYREVIEHPEQQQPQRVRIPVPLTPEDAEWRELALLGWNARRCYECGTTWGEHYGKLCASGIGEWHGPEMLRGYDAAGDPVWEGDEAELTTDARGRWPAPATPEITEEEAPDEEGAGTATDPGVFEFLRGAGVVTLDGAENPVPQPERVFHEAITRMINITPNTDAGDPWVVTERRPFTTPPTLQEMGAWDVPVDDGLEDGDEWIAEDEQEAAIDDAFA